MLTSGRKPRGIGSYKPKEKEQRGKTFTENKTLGAFWAQYSMDEVITWTEAELEEKIEKYLLELKERSLKNNPNWWYPEWKKLDPRYYK